MVTISILMTILLGTLALMLMEMRRTMAFPVVAAIALAVALLGGIGVPLS